MPIKNVNIVPKNPAGMGRPMTASSGGRMLGFKMGVQQAGMNMRQNQRLGQQADLANQRISISRQRANQIKGKTGKATLSNYIQLFNAHNREIMSAYKEEVKQYNKLIDGGFNPKTMGVEKPQPPASTKFPDFVMDQFGVDVSEYGMMGNTQQGGAGMVAPARPVAFTTEQNFTKNPQLGWQAQGPEQVVRGFAEGGIVNSPQMAMVGEQGKEFIVPENKISPDMAAQLQQIVGGQGGQGGQVPTREGLAQLMSQMPNPEKIVSDKLPKVEELIQQIENYEDPEEALKDMVELDTQLMELGMDLADVKGIEQFVQAYSDKFGQEAAQQLVEEAVSRRGQ